MRATLLLLLLVLAAACGEQPSVSRAPGPSAAPSQPPARSPAPSAGVAVTLTGVPVVTGDGSVEWCAAQAVDQECAGVPVRDLPAAAVAELDPTQSWRVDGIFDGTSLRATAAPEPVKRSEPDFTTPCEGLRGRATPSGNADPAVSEAIDRYLATIPDRYAASWWDQQHAVMTILLTGDDVAGHRAALEDAVGDRGTVCVVGGARWSDAELQQMQQRALEIARDEGMGPWWGSPDPVANRVDLEVERSDRASVARIREEAGEAVRVHAFMAVRDGRITDLPVPPPRGDVDLETAETRSGAGMEALAEFTVHYDAEANCVYGGFGQERVGLVWPFGYWAESDPLRVHDADGRVVAREGDRLRGGGGNVPRAGDEVCGAGSVWVMNGAPEVVGPSES